MVAPGGVTGWLGTAVEGIYYLLPIPSSCGNFGL